MLLGIIIINDIGIQIALDEDHILHSPGYAVVHEESIFLGEDGRARFRSLPKWTNNRFWSELSQGALPQTCKHAKSNADLAYLHLKAIWDPLKIKPERVVVVIPSDFGQEKLGILAGICEELEIPLTSFVDASILEASSVNTRSEIIHLDINLHSITLTKIFKEQTTSRVSAKKINDCGYNNFLNNWANTIADQFIRVHRFDPFHSAKTEQDLYDALPNFVAEFEAEAAARFELASKQGYLELTLAKETIVKSCAPLYQRIIEMVSSEKSFGKSTDVLLSPRFKRLPGIKDSLELIRDTQIKELEDSAVISSINRLKDDLVLGSSEAKYFSRVASLERFEEKIEITESKAPTHLLWRDRAFPIGQCFDLGVNPDAGPYKSEEPVGRIERLNSELFIEPFSGDNWELNGRPLKTKRMLSIGDQLKFNGEALVLISEIKDG